MLMHSPHTPRRSTKRATQHNATRMTDVALGCPFIVRRIRIREKDLNARFYFCIKTFVYFKFFVGCFKVELNLLIIVQKLAVQ